MVTFHGKISPIFQPLNVGLSSSLAVRYEHGSVKQGAGAQCTVLSSLNQVEIQTWIVIQR